MPCVWISNVEQVHLKTLVLKRLPQHFNNFRRTYCLKRLACFPLTQGSLFAQNSPMGIPLSFFSSYLKIFLSSWSWFLFLVIGCTFPSINLIYHRPVHCLGPLEGNFSHIDFFNFKGLGRGDIGDIFPWLFSLEVLFILHFSFFLPFSVSSAC